MGPSVFNHLMTLMFEIMLAIPNSSSYWQDHLRLLLQLQVLPDKELLALLSVEIALHTAALARTPLRHQKRTSGCTCRALSCRRAHVSKPFASFAAERCMIGNKSLATLHLFSCMPDSSQIWLRQLSQHSLYCSSSSSSSWGATKHHETAAASC